MRRRNEVVELAKGKQTLSERVGAAHDLRGASEVLLSTLQAHLALTSAISISAACYGF